MLIDRGIFMGVEGRKESKESKKFHCLIQEVWLKRKKPTEIKTEIEIMCLMYNHSPY